MDYPLLGFQVVYADTSGPPVLARSGTRLQYVTADDNGDVRLWTLLEVGLEVGVVYHVAVRLQNANNADLEGFGPWSTTATTVCVDGLSRPTVCPGPGITALSFPSPPPALGIRPKGNRTLLFEWLRSADTGSGDSQYPLVAVEIELEEESGANSLLLAAPGEAFEFISPPLRPGIFYRARDSFQCLHRFVASVSSRAAKGSRGGRLLAACNLRTVGTDWSGRHRMATPRIPSRGFRATFLSRLRGWSQSFALLWCLAVRCLDDSS